MFKFLKILSYLALCLCLSLGGLWFYYQKQLEPAGKAGFLLVEPGDTLRRVANNLAKGGLIKNAKAFEAYGRWQGLAKVIKAGEYELSAGMDASAIFAKLQKGERLVKKFTVPEGYTYQQVSEILKALGIVSQAEASKAFKDQQYLSSLGFEAFSLEGYLFPDTYYYDSTTGVEKILKRMLEHFLSQIKPRHRQRLQELDWTVAEWITLAAMIQKEAGQNAEMPLISSVFHNRLQKGMLLQSDPTIIYGLKNFDGNIRRKDINKPHAYNTYQHAGLPPGPIANPGLAAMEAALFPAKSDYLFFVAKGKGAHHFSTTLKEHNRAVRHYQIKGLKSPLPH